MNLGDDFLFQQDNDPKHTVHNVKLRLLYNVKNQLHILPQLSNLNPTQHLWDLLEHKIWQYNITSKENLKKVIMIKLNNISSNETRLVQSMPKRLTEVFKHKDSPQPDIRFYLTV